MAVAASNFVLSEEALEKLAGEACAAALSSASSYDHSKVSPWNNAIIESVLHSLRDAAAASPTPYKYSVTSTIIQHDSADKPFPLSASRGMHSASGAFWDAKTDGMWSFKYSGQGERGFDVVVTVLWVSTGRN